MAAHSAGALCVLVLSSLVAPCACRLGAGSSPMFAGDLSEEQARPRLMHFLKGHKEANVVEMDLNCSSVMLPKFAKRSVDLCRSLVSHQQKAHSLMDEIIEMLGRERNVKTTKKLNVVDAGGELGMSAVRLARHEDVASLYTVQPSTELCEFLERVADKNRNLNVHVLNRFLGDSDGKQFKNLEDAEQAPIAGNSLDHLVEIGELPKKIDLIHFGENEKVEQQVIGAMHTMGAQKPVLVTAVRLPRDKSVVETMHQVQKLGYASFALDESCAVTNGEEGICRNIIHVPVGDVNLQESISLMLRDRSDATPLVDLHKQLSELVK